jgi:hypothetical protein
MPCQTVAAVATVGDPSLAAPAAISALYRTVYALKRARRRAGADFQIGRLRARWSGADPDGDGRLAGDRAQWVGVWALPIPDDVEALPRTASDLGVTVDRWPYGTVAEALHLGPYATEPTTVECLRQFAAEQGYEIVGPHEEEYLTRPSASLQKTLVRYRVRKRPPA